MHMDAVYIHMRSRGGRGWPGERSGPEGDGSEEPGSGPEPGG
jgi:hypothetical protein